MSGLEVEHLSLNEAPPSVSVEAPRSVLISAVSIVGYQYVRMMEIMRERFDTRFSVLSPSPEHSAHFQKGFGESDRVINPLDHINMTPPSQLSEKEVFAQARRNEIRYNLLYMREILQFDRHVITRFNPAAPYSVRGTYDKREYIEVYAEVNDYFSMYERIFKEDMTDLVIVRPDSIEGAVMTNVAIGHDIPVTFLAAANHQDLMHWACGPYNSGEILEERMQQSSEHVEQEHDDEYLLPQYMHWFSTDRDKMGQFSYLVREIYNVTRDRTHHLILDLINGKIPKRISYVSTLLYFFNKFRSARALKSMCESSPEVLTDKPFILYLLQVEPEYGTLCLAREFSNVETIIYQLAMSMPAGHNIIIKEHVPNIGNRSIDFYKRLKSIPNVVLADYRIAGHKLAESATVISTVSGTVGKQSTLLGKPAIVFSAHVNYSHMPNVRIVKSFFDLPKIVEWAFKKKSKDELESWKAEGAKYYKTVEDVSFVIEDNRIFDRASDPFVKGKSIRTGENDHIVVERLLETYSWLKKHGTPT